MPRQARSSSATGIYHVMMRGVNRQNIFDDDEDYQHFMRIPLNELREFINEPCTADCIEFDNCRRLTDMEVREIIQNRCGVKTVSDFY